MSNARLVARCLLPALVLCLALPVVGSAAASQPAAAAAGAAAPPPAALPAAKLKPCHVEGLEEEARCGTYPRWEDRAAKSGRKIDLNIVLLPALGSDRV